MPRLPMGRPSPQVRRPPQRIEVRPVPYASTRTLVVQRGAGSSGAPNESPVRVVPAWAQPPNTQVLVMLGETATEAPAALRVIRHRLEQKRAEGMWTFAV